MTANLYAPPKAPLADIAEGGAAPALWNPNAAASWSVVFSPAFGAFLHMKNWEALGEPAKAASAKMWAVTTLMAIIGLALAAVFMPNMALAGIPRIVGFALLISWYYMSGKPQADFVKSRYGKEYPRKEWAKPLLAAVAAFGAFVALIIAAGAVVLAVRHA